MIHLGRRTVEIPIARKFRPPPEVYIFQIGKVALIEPAERPVQIRPVNGRAAAGGEDLGLFLIGRAGLHGAALKSPARQGDQISGVIDFIMILRAYHHRTDREDALVPRNTRFEGPHKVRKYLGVVV